MRTSGLFPAEWAPTWPFAAVAAASVIAGGLVAAASAPAPTEAASWTAAYLVLVCGVAQLALALGQVTLTSSPPQRLTRGQFALWNIGNALVIVGVLVTVSWVVTGGSVLLVVALASFSWAARHRRTRDQAWLLLGYRALLAFLLVSVATGTVLAQL